jgi:hypothetical protein
MWALRIYSGNLWTWDKENSDRYKEYELLGVLWKCMNFNKENSDYYKKYMNS